MRATFVTLLALIVLALPAATRAEDNFEDSPETASPSPAKRDWSRRAADERAASPANQIPEANIPVTEPNASSASAAEVKKPKATPRPRRERVKAPVAKPAPKPEISNLSKASAAAPIASSTARPALLVGGQELSLSIKNDPALSGSLKIDAAGMVNLPLVGPLPLAGLTVAEAEEKVRAAYADGYFVKPQVTLILLGE